MANWLEPKNLIGKIVELAPLKQAHRDFLVTAADDGELWKYGYTSVPSEDSIDSYIEFALEEQDKERALPFIVINKKDNSIKGCTRFCNVEYEHKRLEIGYTWYSKSFQRTGVNTECKYLLLRHAFEELEAKAVEFRTNWFNHKSRSAILRLGAKQDGVLRNHRIDKDGTLRDTVVFSIIQSEWNAVKKSLGFEKKKYRN